MYEDHETERIHFDSEQSGQNNGFTYSYQPSGNGGHSNRPHGTGISILTVLLCIILSFGAGVAGATMVCESQSKKTETETGVEAPDANSVHRNDATSVLSRSESEYSTYGSAGEDAYSISTVVQLVQNAVVVINASSNSGTSAGSGVIISAEGYILTCNHVVDGMTTIAVTVNNCESAYLATKVGYDESTDLAVLKIAPQEDEPLTSAIHGISDNLVVGEHVVAIGNPLGTLGGTVTDGIISAKARRVETDNGTMTLLQTNAAINSGNSGGGLFNLKGELVGIVNAKYASSGVEGLAFAIPIDTAYEVEKDLIQYGYVIGTPDIGITFVEVNSSNLRAYNWRYGITETGLYVISSKYCELKNKDRIVSVNGKKVTTESEYDLAVEGLKAGDSLTVTYIRSSSGSTEQSVTFEIPQYVPSDVTTGSTGVNFSS